MPFIGVTSWGTEQSGEGRRMSLEAQKEDAPHTPFKALLRTAARMVILQPEPARDLSPVQTLPASPFAADGFPRHKWKPSLLSRLAGFQLPVCKE